MEILKIRWWLNDPGRSSNREKRSIVKKLRIGENRMILNMLLESSIIR